METRSESNDESLARVTSTSDPEIAGNNPPSPKDVKAAIGQTGMTMQVEIGEVPELGDWYNEGGHLY